MRAVVVRRFGGPEVLEVDEVDDPVAGSGEVVVEVAAVDVIGLDAAIRAGAGEMFGIAPPYVPGDGLAGTVVAVGRGVGQEWQGCRVAVATGAQGAVADRVVVPEASLVSVPGELDLEHAAALVLHEAAHVDRGQRVLIMPAASGLGLVLVQLAKSAGAEVLAVAGGSDKLGVAGEHGADVLLDYTSPGWAEVLGQSVDVVFDGAGGHAGPLAFAALRRGGRYLSYGDTSGSYGVVSTEVARERGITLHGPEVVHLGGSARTRELTRRAFADAVAGRVRPLVAGRHSWGGVVDAHREQESRATVGRPLLVR